MTTNDHLPVRLTAPVTWAALSTLSYSMTNGWPEKVPQDPTLCYLHEGGMGSAPRRIAWAAPRALYDGQPRYGLLPVASFAAPEETQSQQVASGFGAWVPVREQDAVVMEWESCTSGALLTATRQEDGNWTLTYTGPDPSQHAEESMYLLAFMKTVTGPRFAAVATVLGAPPEESPKTSSDFPQEGMLQEINPETPMDEVIRFTGLALLAEEAVHGGATTIEFRGRGLRVGGAYTHHFYLLRGGKYEDGTWAVHADDELLWAAPGDTDSMDALSVLADVCGVSVAPPRRRGGFRVRPAQD